MTAKELMTHARLREAREAGAPSPPPWHDVPIYEGRDLASDELWKQSLALARAKRELAKSPLRLPKARRASVSLVAAAIVVATPALSSAHSGSSGKASRAIRSWSRAVLELGDRGPAVVRLQRALGVRADGIFGPRTLKAVRSFQARERLVVDGIVGPKTRAALRSGGASRELHSHSAVSGIDTRLAGALALAKGMGLTLLSAHRPGATIAASGRRSDHSYFPSKAIDLQGSAADMERYALAVAGKEGVETVIYSPVGLWTPGSGWHPIGTQVTYEDHLDHVHVDTF